MGTVLSAVIVIPCYNEGARLDPDAFARFLAAESHVRFLFVDDGSTDTTAGIVAALGREWPDRVQLLRLDRNYGKAEAVRRGIVDAATLHPDVIGYWDADLATPVDEIRAMVSWFEDDRIGVVIGSRVRMLGRDIRRSAFRHYVGRAFATLASMQLRLPVYDTQCGAKIFRASPDITRVFSRPFRLRWCFDVELLARFDALHRIGRYGTCVEHPLSRWADVGASKLTMRQALRVLPELMMLPSVMRNERNRESRAG